MCSTYNENYNENRYGDKMECYVYIGREQHVDYIKIELITADKVLNMHVSKTQSVLSKYRLF